MLLTINAGILENKSGRYVAVGKSDAYINFNCPDCSKIQMYESDHILKTEKLILNDENIVSALIRTKIINCYVETSLLVVNLGHRT